MQRHVFGELGCTALWCGHCDGNDRSKRVQQKRGFTLHHVERDVDCLLIGDVSTERFAYLSRGRLSLLQELGGQDALACDGGERLWMQSEAVVDSENAGENSSEGLLERTANPG